MAGARAIGQLTRAVELTLYRLRVDFRLELLCMAAAAGAGFGAGSKHQVLGIGVLALLAGQRAAVLSRVLGRGVPVADRVPIRVGMAGLAFAGRGHVARRFADCARVVVAVGTPGHQRRVINFCGSPGQSAVAGVALFRGGNVIARQPRGMHSVMAAGTGLRCRRCVLNRAGVQALVVWQLSQPRVTTT